MKATLSLRDDRPVIETNKARLRETGTFFDEYQKFKADVLEFDDWRCTREDQVTVRDQQASRRQTSGK